MGNEILELLRKKVTAQMLRDQLEQYIVKFLKSHNMCMLATAKDNVPRATPIEYYSDGTTVYMIGDPGNKLDNIRSNPQVSIGIHDPLTGWLSVKGAQITGEATLITEDNPEHLEAMKIYKWWELGKELGQDKPPSGRIIIKIEAKKIEIVEIALKQRGYAARQVWEAQES
ncbi:pyridoxamine 5'-phosphate oxidase family protein [Chloroflexota bacterium]